MPWAPESSVSRRCGSSCHSSAGSVRTSGCTVRRPERSQCRKIAVSLDCSCAWTAGGRARRVSGDVQGWDGGRRSHYGRTGFLLGDYSPFTIWNAADAGYEGDDIGRATAFASAHDVELAFVPTTWPTLMNDLPKVLHVTAASACCLVTHDQDIPTHYDRLAGGMALIDWRA